MIFKDDCTSVLNRVSKPREDVMLLGYKIQECVSLLNSKENYTVRWYARACNTVANYLSRFALENMYTAFFSMDIPDMIQSLVILDSI